MLTVLDTISLNYNSSPENLLTLLKVFFLAIKTNLDFSPEGKNSRFQPGNGGIRGHPGL